MSLRSTCFPQQLTRKNRKSAAHDGVHRLLLVERHQTWCSVLVDDSTTRYCPRFLCFLEFFLLGLLLGTGKPDGNGNLHVCVFLPLVFSSSARANRSLLLCILCHLLDLLYPAIIRRPRAWMTSPTSKACSFQMASWYLFEYPRSRIPILLLPIRSISSMGLEAGQHNA